MSISNSPEETAAAGAQWAREAQVGDVFALVGEVGAGKTQFAKGFVAEMGSAADVTSPTFTLVHEYGDGRLPVYHFDFYRLDSPDAVVRLGFDEYAAGDGVCLIEWADRFPELLPPNAVTITIESRGESQRVLQSSPAR
ncbi:MAG: tRNA (adenosine(37)-N6)-threonylcarbamoyltransferase complex ATPase subunit type 1 TsaE [Chthoniobacterales bacterium]